jgi:hypothetical protein
MDGSMALHRNNPDRSGTAIGPQVHEEPMNAPSHLGGECCAP